MRWTRRHPGPDSGDLTRAVVEVASIKANAQSLIRRIRSALDDLEATVGLLPGEEVSADDVPGAGEADDA